LSAQASGPSAIGAAVLAQSARALCEVALAGHSAGQGLALAALDAPLAPRAAVRAVTLGSLRWYPRLEPIIGQLLAGKALAPILRSLLITAVHQLDFSNNAPEATVFCAVDAARLLRQARAAGLVNALLRRYLREREALLRIVLQDDCAASAHPGWLLGALRESWPQHWQQIVAANNEHPPMSLRVDLSRITREAYGERLRQHGLGARAIPWLHSALVLDKPVPVERLPGFTEGLVSVQDAGAQLASALLAAQPGERILDACAAPGGKTGALLEALDGAIELTAVDIDPARTGLIEQNLQRLGRHARVLSADLRSELSWWNGVPFDRILLDAPCSATGVIRRHPDIKLLRREADIAALEPTQRSLLLQCLGLLKVGGRLLYSTCSVLRAENEALVQAVLACNSRARSVPVEPLGAGLGPASVPWQQCAVGVQMLPGAEALSDGFYYACLTVT
jgi:16S rRNA (cytosine967-C5)-methyltransferase